MKKENRLEFIERVMCEKRHLTASPANGEDRACVSVSCGNNNPQATAFGNTVMDALDKIIKMEYMSRAHGKALKEIANA